MGYAFIYFALSPYTSLFPVQYNSADMKYQFKITGRPVNVLSTCHLLANPVPNVQVVGWIPCMYVCMFINCNLSNTKSYFYMI